MNNTVDAISIAIYLKKTKNIISECFYFLTSLHWIHNKKYNLSHPCRINCHWSDCICNISFFGGFIYVSWLCLISKNEYYGTAMCQSKARYMFFYWCELHLVSCVHSTSHNSLWWTKDTINTDILQLSPEPELSQSH